MKLYYLPGACSMAPHIVAQELSIPLVLDRVDYKTKQTESGKDFLAINPKGYVPALELDDGQVLTEGPAIMQYLADLKPGTGLTPAVGSMARYRLIEMLGYINSELHKTYSPLFNPNTAPEIRNERIAYLKQRYAFLDTALSKSPYLLGDELTLADAYLFTVTGWARMVNVDLSEFAALQAFQTRVAQRPATQAAMRAEGLIKA